MDTQRGTPREERRASAKVPEVEAYLVFLRHSNGACGAGVRPVGEVIGQRSERSQRNRSGRAVFIRTWDFTLNEMEGPPRVIDNGPI